MAVQFNHTIIHVHDNQASANFLAELLDLPTPKRFGPFFMVQTSNGVSLDFKNINVNDKVIRQHYAFLVDEIEFDAIFARICQQKILYWADPGQTHAGKINYNDGGRGVYFEDPNGHLMEIITHPYSE